MDSRVQYGAVECNNTMVEDDVDESGTHGSTTVVMIPRHRLGRRHYLLPVVAVVVLGVISWIYDLRLPGFGSSEVSLTRDTDGSLHDQATTLTTKGSVCTGYDGVLHIRSGDTEADAGTVFFMYIVNQLIYAEQNNLLPWIHLTNVSGNIYDVQVHGTNHSVGFEMLQGMTVDFVSDDYHGFGSGSYPGPPKKLLEDQPLKPRMYSVSGTGVWDRYLEPVSAFDPASATSTSGECRDKPLIRMHYFHLNPGLLLYCPWSVRSWPYDALASRLAPQTTLKDWYWPMRQRASEIVQKYSRFRPDIVQRVDALWQGKEDEDRSSCLALHIRHSDKGGTNQKPIPLESFLPYVEAYLQAGGTRIVLATDSAEVITSISTWWPKNITRTILRQPDDVVPSSNREDVFVLGDTNHDRTNRQVLVDILAMSQCGFMVHGFSAVSEAAIYLNLHLHENSVDLEDHPLNMRLTPSEFQAMVESRRSKEDKP